MQSSVCLPWQIDKPASPAGERNDQPRSYTTSGDTIAPEGFVPIGVIAEPKDADAVPRPSSSAPLMGHTRGDGGVAARRAMDERPGMIEIDLPCGTRLRVDALVNERALRRVLSMLRSLS